MGRGTVNAPRARIVCISKDDACLDALTVSFHDAGYEVITPGSCAADLCAVDLRTQNISSKKVRSIAAVLRHKSPEAAIFFLIDPGLNARGRAALRRFGEVIPATDTFEHLLERCRQMLRLRNIAEESGERMKSLAALNKLVEFPAIATSNEPLNILIAGAPGPAASSCISAVSCTVDQYTGVLTAGQTLRALDHNDFDAAIFLPLEQNDTLYSVTRAMRRNKKYAGVPIIHIAEDESTLPLLAKQGASEFMLRGHITDDLGVKIQLAARRYRLLRSMRDFLRACTGVGVRDQTSGAFTASFLAEHGARICARADQTGRPLSAALIQLTASSDVETRPGHKIMHQAARLMNRITRAEDLTARIGPDTFVVLCPATIAADVQTMALRIDGVLTNTVFREGQTNTLHSVTVNAAICARNPGTAIEEVIAALIKEKNNQAPATPPRLQSPE